jgi:4-hydroxyphenylpyruvate dioxygenase-like putative hemolysin
MTEVNRDNRLRPWRKESTMMNQPSSAEGETSTTEPMPRLNHVVFAIGYERLDAATEFMTKLGFEFQAVELEELGLQIRLDWARGFELISPMPNAPTDRGSAAEFLSRNGDGLFSVVVRVADSTAAEHIANEYGSESDFRQALEGDGFEFSEVKLEALFGIPITLLQTNVP